jgi:hypothetical protein
MAGQPVAVLRDGHEVGSVMTGADGSYRFTLAPGDYAVEMPCGVSLPATVPAGGSVSKDYTCQVP